MKFKVGLFIFIFLINIAIAISYLLVQKGVFDKHYTYYFKAFSAEPYRIGMPIKVSGFKIGYVDSIKLLADTTVQIGFSVDESNRRWVLKESVIMIKKPLLGETNILLYTSAENPILEDESELKVFQTDDINDLIFKLTPVVEKIENIVTSVDKITTYLAKDDSEIIKILKNIEKFSDTLAKNNSLLTTITGDQSATNALTKSVKKLPAMMDNFNSLSKDVKDDILPPISEFVKELGNIAVDIKQKLKKLDSVVNSVDGYKGDIDKIKEDIKVSIIKSNQILDKVNSIFIDKNNKEVTLP
jgi:ABC-type transporter Mla subunit MlaD